MFALTDGGDCFQSMLSCHCFDMGIVEEIGVPVCWMVAEPGLSVVGDA